MRFPIEGFPGYEMDETGQVYRKPHEWRFGKSVRRVGEVKLKRHQTGFMIYRGKCKRYLSGKRIEEILERRMNVVRD